MPLMRVLFINDRADAEEDVLFIGYKYYLE